MAQRQPYSVSLKILQRFPKNQLHLNKSCDFSNSKPWIVRPLFSYNDVLNADRGVPSDKRPRASVSYSMRKQVFNFVAIRDSIFR